MWSPGKVDVDDCGRQFVSFGSQQQQQHQHQQHHQQMQQVRPPNSAYDDVTSAGVRYGVAAPYEHTVRGLHKLHVPQMDVGLTNAGSGCVMSSSV